MLKVMVLSFNSIFADFNSLNLISDFLPMILRIFKKAAGGIGEEEELRGSTPGQG